MCQIKTILLVDDESSVLVTLQMIFESEGYVVTTAQDGNQALRILGERNFDTVVTDLNMERENVGLEVAQAAVAKRPKPAVVVCTGYATLVQRAWCPVSRRAQFRLSGCLSLAASVRGRAVHFLGLFPACFRRQSRNQD